MLEMQMLEYGPTEVFYQYYVCVCACAVLTYMYFVYFEMILYVLEMKTLCEGDTLLCCRFVYGRRSCYLVSLFNYYIYTNLV